MSTADLLVLPAFGHPVSQGQSAWPAESGLRGGGGRSSRSRDLGDTTGYRWPRWAVLRSFDYQTGEKRQDDLALPAKPVLHGVSVGAGRVYVACADGSLVCFGAAE